MLSAVLQPSMAQPIDPQSFYAHLHGVARERGMKTSAVVKKAGLTPQAAEKWKAATAPRIETRQRLAKALGVHVSRLIRDGEQLDEEVISPPAASPANDAASDDRYPSLVEFLLQTPTLEDERHYLERQRFLFGDPGTEAWGDLIEAYRKAKRAKAPRPAIASTVSAQKPRRER